MEATKSVSETTAVEFAKMIGTEGSLAYIVVGIREGLRVGIRPLIGVGPQDLMLSMRLRVASKTVDDEGIDSVEGLNVADEVSKMYPRVKFRKRSEKRCSVVISQTRSTLHYLTEGEYEQLLNEFLASSVNEIFMALGGTEWVTNPEAVVEYIKGYFKSEFDMAMASINPDLQAVGSLQ